MPGGDVLVGVGVLLGTAVVGRLLWPAGVVASSWRRRWDSGRGHNRCPCGGYGEWSEPSVAGAAPAR